MNRKTLIITIGILLLVLVALMLAVLTPNARKAQRGPQKVMVTSTNLTLDIRYEYDTNLLVPVPSDPRAEFPLQLDGIDWGLYGKRIRGVGALLEVTPGPMLFDFVASQHTDTYENWYLFEMVEEHYEDATIKDKLAVHCEWVFQRNADSKEWPGYFPEAVKSGNQVQMESWAMFSNNDLFYFYTFSPSPIGEVKQAAVVEFLNSIEFGALLDSDKPRPSSENPEAGQAETDSGEPVPDGTLLPGE